VLDFDSYTAFLRERTGSGHHLIAGLLLYLIVAAAIFFII